MALWTNLKNKVISTNPYTVIKQLKHRLKISMASLLKPFSGDHRYQNTLLYPRYPFGLQELYDFAYSSDVLTITHNALRRELFRNGYDLIVAKKSDEETTSSEEEVEAGKDEDKQNLDPRFQTREGILEFLENINENDQSIIDVSMELEDDFSILDDAFMLFIFDYEFNLKNGKVTKKTLKEVQRADPRYMGLVMNKYDRPGYDEDNNKLTVCPQHRGDMLENKERCPQCQLVTFPAHYFSDYGSEKIFYGKEEVVFKSKYRPTKRRGYSPVLTTWQKTRTLFFMDKYIMELYVLQRPPKGGLFFKTSNQAGLKKSWDQAKQEANDNPHHPIAMAIPDSSSGQDFVKYIDFMRNLTDLEQMETRNEMRRQVGAVYGVMPVYQADMSQGGGLNNEGMEVTITNRAAEYGQSIYNQYFYLRLFKAMGLKGWSFTLNPTEEQDEMAKLERQQLTLVNGQLAVSMGLDAEYSKDSGEVIIKPGALELQQTDTGFGSFPGAKPPSFGNTNSRENSPKLINMAKADILKAASKRPPFTKIADVIKRELNKFFNKFKRQPTEVEMSKALAKMNLEMTNEIRKATQTLFDKTYKNTLDQVGGELGINVTFDTIDENALEALLNKDTLTKAFEGLSADSSKRVNDIITDSFKTQGGLDPKEIQKRIKEISNVSDFKAETIARTEVGKVSSSARRVSFQKEDDFKDIKFKWIGPSDLRTTDTSKSIKTRTKGGVSYDELVKIVTEESAKEFPTWKVDKNALQSHFNSRHTFIRKF